MRKFNKNLAKFTTPIEESSILQTTINRGKSTRTSQEDRNRAGARRGNRGALQQATSNKQQATTTRSNDSRNKQATARKRTTTGHASEEEEPIEIRKLELTSSRGRRATAAPSRRRWRELRGVQEKKARVGASALVSLERERERERSSGLTR
ncbi:hypothetical protein ACJRO7_003594 [Eucalyptus globulus]|uniref:Uncharacterized protein n=1 Tax=Eucalyptus globulus TaxID=34317 RepID=A0ABD3IUX5_EUCGL